MRKLNAKDLLIGICFLLAVSVGAATVYWKDLLEPNREIVFSTGMSLRELARENGMPVKEIVHILSHEDRTAWNWSRSVPISTLSVKPQKVHLAIEHVVKEATPSRDFLRFLLWGVYLMISLGILATRKKIGRVRLFFLLGTVAVFGIFLGPTPNPMEAMVKVFKTTKGMEADPFEKAVLLTLFTLMAIVGNKLICGWGCQLGALQDLIHRLSPFKQIKHRQVPFWLANGTRVVLFVIFLDLLIGFVFRVNNFVLYHHLNFFKLYNWTLAPLALTLLPVLLVFSFLVYRPFCQFVCPFGLYSWVLENMSLYRVRVSESLCIHCENCVRACPTQAMKGRMNYTRKGFLPDCWACGACVEACPTDSVVFGRKCLLGTAEQGKTLSVEGVEEDSQR